MDDSSAVAQAADNNHGTHGTHVINGINGAAKSSLNGRALRPRRTARPRGPGMLARTLSIAARLLTWYTILTILLRCPGSLDACDDASPRICKPYLQLKRAVAPHVEPYYDAYAAPYVDLVRPYYHAVDQRILTPGWNYAKQHGGPRLQQVQALGRAQWDRSVQPQVDKYRGLARARYDERLAPHIRRVSAAAGPYYDIARTNALQTYHELLLPAYRYAQPRLRDGYRAAAAFTGRTVVPAFAWTWNKTYAFLDGTVGPRLRAIYTENVEPQLVKISKRLGRHNTGKKSVPKPPPPPSTDAAPSVSTETASSFAKPAVSVSATSAASSATPPPAAAASEKSSSATAHAGRTRATMEPVPPPEADELEQESEVRRSARETVAADLRDWQERYAKAADEGAAEIDQRVHEIAKRMLRRDARVTGQALLEQLQVESISQLVTLRRAILDVIGTVNRGAASRDDAQEQIVLLVRRTGLAVKEKAQAVRTWRERYEAELRTAITKAAETHFAILENIRDLALQRIGMKWAWMDGVTYKDWAKYHLLKSRFDEWKADLETHIVTHPTLEAAQLAAADIEDSAMKAAASTAKELARLKQVAAWKLAAGDASPEFDSTLMQQAAEAAEAARQAVEGAAEAVEQAVEGAAEAVEQAVEGAAEAVEQTAGGATDAAADGIAHVASLASEAASFASEAVEGGASLASEAVSRATDVMLGASEQSAPLDPESPPAPESPAAPSESAAEPSVDHEDVQTSASDDAASPETTSEPELETDPAGADEPSSVAEPTSDANPNVASSMIFETPVTVGNVTEQTDDETGDQAGPVELPVEDTQAVEDREDTQAAEDREEDDIKESAGQASTTTSVKPALFGAAAQSVPSRQPILDDDVADAMESMQEHLKSVYSAAMSRANDQYSRALSVVSAQIRGTPNPVHEQLLASVTVAYSQAMASASSRLDHALRVASEQLHGTKTTTTTTTHILPTAEPAVSEQLARQYAAASSIVSELLVGREPSFSESVVSRLSAAFAAGTSAASQAGEAVKSVGDRVASAASSATAATKDEL